MDPDTSHAFSKSSRDTLITTAVVGKLIQSCNLKLFGDQSMLSTISQNPVSFVVTRLWHIQALHTLDVS